MSERTPDFAIIGSGPNGLVAASVLARAGASVVVLEAHPSRAGGAVGSEEATLPGFLHDVGAAFFTFGRSSPAFRELGLEAHGVEWLNAPFESCHPAPDGSAACISRDADFSARHFGDVRDGEAWRRLAHWHARIERPVIETLLGPIPTVRPALGLLPHALRLARIFTSSGRRLACRRFQSTAARRVIPGLALHADVGPDDTFGAGLGYILALEASTSGFSVPRGGSREVTRALERILAAHGGRILLGHRVTRVLVRERRTRGVVCANGNTIEVRHGVLADTAAASLLLDLVEREHVPARLVRSMERFVQGWPTFKMDWALDAAVPWTAEPARQSAVVHAGDDLDDLARFTNEVRSGRLSERPYLVIGQQSLVDPSRAPQGRHTLWAYTHVPQRQANEWASLAESYADCIEERIEELAPGFRRTVLARRIVTPLDLEAMDANLVGGDLGGGSNVWTRQLIFRPAFPWFRYRMPPRGLYLCSSYTHPGAGVHGMCGYNAARTALSDID